MAKRFDTFADGVRDALSRLHDQVYLQGHALAAVLPPDGAPPHAGAGVRRGAALSRELHAAIEALRPSVAAGNELAVRRHRVLALRYVEGMDVDVVVRELAISRRQYFYENQGALAALTAALRERWRLDQAAASGHAAVDDASEAGSAAAPTNLPNPPTSFIGRERSIAQALDLLASARLLTLTGPPGTGKTRLALAVARRVADGAVPRELAARFADGVRFVGLGAVVDPALVIPTIAHALGVPETERLSPAEALPRYLRSRRLLLLLDNFEQVTAAAPELAALASACPGLTLLVTSRSPLRLPGEQELPVAPLAMPDPSYVPGIDQLLQYEAIRLFFDRARAQRPDLALDPAQGAAVARICRQLDGLPLAIELAAARTRILSVEQIAARLHDLFRLLGQSTPAAPPHQRSLRAAVDWSYALLPERERTLLRRLSVSASGCDLEAAEAVAGQDDALDGLAALAEQSLLVAEERDGRVRYRLLETIRQYAHERLREAGELAAVRDRHLDWCTRLAEAGDARVFDPDDLARLEREHEELRAALRWAIERGDPEAGFRLLRAAFGLWYVRDHFAEGRTWFAELAALPGGDRPKLWRAGALAVAAQLAYCQCAFDAGEAHAREAIAISRANGDEATWALATNVLGNIAFGRGDLVAARRLYEEARAINCRRGQCFWELTGLFALARTSLAEGDLAGARGLAESALDGARRLCAPWIVARLLRTLGRVAALTGDSAAARELFEEGLALQRGMNDHQGEAQMLISLAEVADAEGEPARAGQLYAEALRLAWEADQRREVVLCLEGLAARTADACLDRGVRVAAAADCMRQAAGGVPWPAERARLESWRHRARAALGDAAFASAEARGRAMAEEQAVDLAVAPA